MRSEKIKLRDKIRKKVYNAKPEVKLRLKERSLIKSYGINLVEYNKLAEQQNFLCKICSKHKDACNKLGLVVDHNHKTGEVRALLCNECNLILGYAKDNINILNNCINYLKDFENVSKS
jgi:hypothetical protein